MFCSNCGHQNLEEAKFCLNCGGPLGRIGIDAAPQPGSDIPPPEAPGTHGDSSPPIPAAADPPGTGGTPPSPQPRPAGAVSPPAAKPRGGPNWGLILGCSCGAIALLCIALVLGLFLFGKKYFDKNNMQALFSPTPAPTQTAGGGEIFQPDAKYKKAAMCKSLLKGQRPGEKADVFTPDEKFYCSVDLSDMEEGDRVTGKWYKGEEFIKEATVSITSRGTNFVGFTLTPAATWETGDDYCLEIFINDVIRGKLTFGVREDASSSSSGDEKHWKSFLKDATLCKSVDENYCPVNPTESFGTGEKFYCSVEVQDLPPATKALGKWYHDSEVIDQKDVSLKDGGNGFISFSCISEKEWPEGDYSIEIYLDSHLVETKKFSVSRVEE